MVNVYLKDIILFNSLDKKSKVDFIIKRLSENGLSPIIQPFSSCFGVGENIYVEYENNNENTTVISAHYDGESFFDNTGGVIALLNLSKEILANKFSSSSLVLLFTDQEETYQQGSAYFIRNNIKYHIVKNINIDGFGIGDDIFEVSSLIDNTNSRDNLFLCDSDEFIKFGIPSITYFSSFRSDFLDAQRIDTVYSVFEKYISNSFYYNNINNHSINKLSFKLCSLISTTLKS